MTKNRAPKPVYLDPGMHPGLEVKGLRVMFAECYLIVGYAKNDDLNLKIMSYKLIIRTGDG